MRPWGLVFVFLLLSPAAAQQQPGVGIDAHGGAVIDPTKNVLDLVQAAIRRQDDLREAEDKLQNALRDAETRRVNELAVQKQNFDLELARILKANTDASTLLLAAQVKELKNDSDSRFAKLEQFRYESSGQNSGRGDVFGWIAAGFFALTTMGSMAMNYLSLQRAKAGR